MAQLETLQHPLFGVRVLSPLRGMWGVPNPFEAPSKRAQGLS